MSSSGCSLAAPRAADTPNDPAVGREPPLLGRARELAALRALAPGSALVLRGEAGTGKSTLLAEFARLTADRRVLRLAGIAAEAEMAWAALHRLLLAFPAELDRLPGAQRAAVDIAVGIGDGGTPDAGAVERAVLAVLAGAAAAAGEAGLVCMLDDLQWIDRESLAVLHAVARRAAEVPLILLAAVCEPAPVPALAGVGELALAGLTVEAGGELLLRAAATVLDRRSAEQLALLADGNPLTLSETGRRLASGQADVLDMLTGQPQSGLALPVRFTAAICALPQPARVLLTLAACDSGGDAARPWRAAAVLGLGPEALAPARDAHVVLTGPGIRFRHPLLRAAALDLASSAQWRAAHRALAQACDQRAEPDAYAWHRAVAATADDAIAANLAWRAHRMTGDRGSLQAASWLVRAARLAATEAAAADHYLAASAAALAAGAPRLAARLLCRARRAADRGAQSARGQRLAARLDGVLGRRAGRSSPDMLTAAEGLAADDRPAALEAMQEAAQLAITAGRHVRGTTLTAIGSALLGMAAGEVPGRPSGPLLPGLATLLTGDYRRAVTFLRQALDARGQSAESPPGAGTALIYAARALWDDQYLLAWPGPGGQAAPPERALSGMSSHDLASTLAAWSAALAGAGHLDEAGWMAGRGRRLARSVGWSPPLLAAFGGAELCAWRGDGPATRQAVIRQEAAAAELERADIGNSATAALMTLHLGRCRYAQAFAAAEQLSTADLGGHANQALSVLVEAATRLGRRESAERALGELRSRACASGTAWALGVLSGCEALLADDSTAAGAYERSIALLDTTAVVSERARARLLYGEWLRRRRQRVAARTWLSAARRLFSQMGAADFAARAQRELDATAPPGSRLDVLSPSLAEPRLTLAERRIAELAAAGATNKEIATELFVSRRTVDHHLRNVYGKLGVRSRRQLGAVLSPCCPEPCGCRS
jgi:DNA-binding CsgD family transcriptional regulator